LLLHMPAGCSPKATDTKHEHKIKTIMLIRFMTEPPEEKLSYRNGEWERTILFS
jgi:hypothetical protein